MEEFSKSLIERIIQTYWLQSKGKKCGFEENENHSDDNAAILEKQLNSKVDEFYK